MSKKLTPWFGSDVKPRRSGVYRTRPPHGRGRQAFQYWSSSRKKWGPYCSSVTGAWRFCQLESFGRPSPEWRGLAEKPK